MDYAMHILTTERASLIDNSDGVLHIMCKNGHEFTSTVEKVSSIHPLCSQCDAAGKEMLDGINATLEKNGVFKATELSSHGQIVMRCARSDHKLIADFADAPDYCPMCALDPPRDLKEPPVAKEEYDNMCARLRATKGDMYMFELSRSEQRMFTTPYDEEDSWENAYADAFADEGSGDENMFDVGKFFDGSGNLLFDNDMYSDIHSEAAEIHSAAAEIHPAAAEIHHKPERSPAAEVEEPEEKDPV